jgi:hypothetical protein
MADHYVTSFYTHIMCCTYFVAELRRLVSRIHNAHTECYDSWSGLYPPWSVRWNTMQITLRPHRFSDKPISR